MPIAPGSPIGGGGGGGGGGVVGVATGVSGVAVAVTTGVGVFVFFVGGRGVFVGVTVGSVGTPSVGIPWLVTIPGKSRLKRKRAIAAAVAVASANTRHLSMLNIFYYPPWTIRVRFSTPRANAATRRGTLLVAIVKPF